MKFKVKSYELKNVRTPSTKSKPLKNKNNNLIGKGKKNGGLKDNRKYANDTTLSETEKLTRRMALEHMKRESVIKPKSQKKNMILSKDFCDEGDTWDNDMLSLKAKQLDGFDEGIDESSEDEVMEDDTEKYFDNGISKKKKTLDEIIRESKIEKYEKNKANEKDVEATLEVNEKYRDEFRFILPKLASSAKAKSTVDYKPDTVFSDMFQENFGALIYAPRPQKADGKSIHTKVNEKKSEKLVETKLKKLREKLAKDGIVNSDGEESEGNNDYNPNMTSDEESDEDVEQESSDDDNQENEDDELEEEGSEYDDVADKCDDEDDDLNDIDLDYQKPDKDNQKNTLLDLKKIINEVNKSTKRKHDDEDEEVSCKKPKVDLSKNEIDCFRVILKMQDLRNEALFVLAQEMSTVDIADEDIARKLILATLFQKALESNSPNSYSPELVGFIRFVLSSAAQDSSSWLSVKSNLTYISENKLLDLCTDNNKDLEKVTLSTIFHALNLLSGVVHSNKNLPNAKSLFAPFKGLIERFPSHFYPLWLMEKLESTVDAIDSITVVVAPLMRMKKVFKIIELLEPDLEDKFDPAKNFVKSQKEKLKKETKATKKEFKTIAMDKIKNEVAGDRKTSQIRNKKTMEIMNGICQK